MPRCTCEYCLCWTRISYEYAPKGLIYRAFNLFRIENFGTPEYRTFDISYVGSFRYTEINIESLKYRSKYRKTFFDTLLYCSIQINIETFDTPYREFRCCQCGSSGGPNTKRASMYRNIDAWPNARPLTPRLRCGTWRAYVSLD